jgi:hypothetical protein
VAGRISTGRALWKGHGNGYVVGTAREMIAHTSIKAPSPDAFFSSPSNLLSSRIQAMNGKPRGLNGPFSALVGNIKDSAENYA